MPGALPGAGCQLGVLWNNFGLGPGLRVEKAPEQAVQTGPA